MELKSQSGQTLVEYILLIVVAVSLVLTVYRSAAFRRIFGEQGSLGLQIKSQNEYAYRHAGPKRTPEAVDVPREHKEGGTHPSYADPDVGSTRFFGPRRAYP
jgi:hypothetical protein